MSDGRVEQSGLTVLYVSGAGADAPAPETLAALDDFVLVRTERSIEDAIQAVSEGQVDCVVSERGLPTGSGVDLVRKIRESHPEVPVVLYAEDGSEVVASEAIAAGVTDYVIKSRDEDRSRLAAAIRSVSCGGDARSASEAVPDGPDGYGEAFENAIANAGHGIIITDTDGEIEYANDRYEQLSGYSAEELRGRTPEIVNSGTHDGAFFADLWETILAGEVWRDTIVNRHKDGDLYVVDETIAPVADGEEITGFVGISADVSDQEQYETAVEAMRDGVVVVNQDLEFVLVNDAFAFLTGIPCDWLLDQNVAAFVESGIVDKETYRALYDHLTAIIAGGATTRQFETSFTSPVMGEIVIDVRVTPVSETRPIQGATISVRNISQRKAREAELEAKNERLEEFTGMVSHDLRNPLNVAVSNLELAQETCETDELDTVAGAHDRMEGLIDDFLALCRQGDLIGSTDPVGLSTVAEAAWRNVQAPETTLRLADDRTLLADAARLRQLFENLFRNAVDHGSSRSGGDDGTDAGRHDVVITVGTLPDGFYVADDGPGIPVDERETVFEAGHTTATKGNGLGLTIVDRITDGHGWTVDVTDSTSGGARFEIRGLESTDT